MSSHTARQSYFELLRIIAMLLVLIVHTDFLSLGAPTSEEIASHPFSSTMRFVVESLSLVCVNVFVLISGYFGIKATRQSICSLLFMVVFWRAFTLVAYLFANPILHLGNDPNVYEIALMLIPGYSDWFVESYILLLLISPVLNAFIDNCSERALLKYVGIYVGFQFILSWAIDIYSQFSYGYSALSFIGLYLMGNALHRFNYPKYKHSVKVYLNYYMLVATFVGVIVTILSFHLEPNHLFLRSKAINMFMAYNGVNVLGCSVLLFLGFKGLHFHSPKVNYVATSVFAVYLFHCHPLMLPLYTKVCKYLFMTYDTIPYICLISLFVIAVFVFSICVDQIRIAIWKAPSPLFTKTSGQARIVA